MTGLPTASGRATRQEPEYVRHGTVSIVAAMDIDTGQVLGYLARRKQRRPEAECKKAPVITIMAGAFIRCAVRDLNPEPAD